jgi:hypothetical protein
LLLSWITSLLGFGSGLFSTLQTISNNLSNEKIALINSKTDQERIASAEKIGALQAQQAVLVADSQRSSIDLLVRSLLALGPTVYLLKIYIYDKVLAQGTTDPLDDNLWWVTMVVVGFYFVHSILRGR